MKTAKANLPIHRGRLMRAMAIGAVGLAGRAEGEQDCGGLGGSLGRRPVPCSVIAADGPGAVSIASIFAWRMAWNRRIVARSRIYHPRRQLAVCRLVTPERLGGRTLP
jgi:hypothetical protein